MLFAFLIFGVLSGGIAATFAIAAGASVLAVLGLYSLFGTIGMLAAAAIILFVSEYRKSPSVTVDKSENAHQVPA
jgi:predicted lipid-binding transport protein (Tim44 family)